MQTAKKFAQKALSVFMAIMMLYSACAIGVDGVYTAYAAQGDSKYTHNEVITLINAALADGKSYTSASDAFTVTGDNGKTLAAADAIFDYAIKTYREGRKSNSKNNSGDTLVASFLNEFKSEFSNQEQGQNFVTCVLNPTGTTVYGYEKKQSKAENTYSGSSDSWGSKGSDVTSNADSSAYPSVADSVTKEVSIKVDVNAFLQSYDTIEEIPASFLTSVSYTYGYTNDKQAILDSETSTTSTGCNATTTYSGSYTGYKWNYMSAKPVRVVEKNTTAKKYLKSILKFFNEDVLAKTQDDLLEMSLSELSYLDQQASGFQKMMNDNFNAATLAHFDVPKSEIDAFVARLAFAHKVVAAKAAIDNMDALVGSKYNVNSYAQMSSLYNKVNSAYNVVTSMSNDTLQFILDNYPEQAAKYSDINFTEAKAYINELHAIMTEQRLEEMVASMMARYDQYYALLDRENIETPTDPEVSNLLSQKNSWNSILGTYTSKTYYRTYYTTEIQAKWEDFAAKINAVAEVRGLKADYQTYYDYFYPLIYTTAVADYSNDALMTLYDEMDEQLAKLEDKYDEITANYNATIANKIFTINYEGTDYLLHELITSVESAGKTEIQNVLVARTEQQIDNVQVYKDVTTVNFDNFAVIKSTISHFDYELYDYVNGKNWLSSDYKTKYGMVQTLLDRYHAFSTTDGKQFFDEDYTFVEDGYYAIRYAGDRTVDTGEVDENGDAIVEQLGFVNDIAREGAGDDFYVDEALMMQTIAKIDNFIVSRDFGTLLGFYDEETEEYLTLSENIDKMLTEMLYNDEMVNTLVGAIFPMLCDLLTEQLIGSLGTMDGASVDENGVPWLDLNALAGISGTLALYLDTQYAPAHDGGNQKDFPQVFKELGLYVFPSTLAESLAISNPSFYGKDSEIYKTLTAAGRDWSNLIVEDDPDTLDVDETKALEFAWGVYDEDSFLDTVACVLDAIVPLLQALFSTKDFKEEVSNVAIGYSPSLLGVDNVFIRGGLRLSIPHLGAYSTLIVPLFEVLGVTNIPNLSSDCSGDDISRGVFGTLLNRIDEILADPLANILEILPNLVYFLSMDSVQEMLDSLVININLNIHEVEVIDFDGWLGYLLDALDGQLAEKIAFDVPLNVADLIEDEGGLYGLLGFELTNFNEVLGMITPMLTDMLGVEGLKLPEIRQQEIIFCSDWVGAAGDKSPLKANKGDLLYWFLNYIISALEDENFMNAILGMIAADSDEETTSIITALVQRITTTFAGNPRGSLAAIVELLNPVDYAHNLKKMDWVESTWNYNGIAGANAADLVYLSYSNDWTEDKANYLVENIDGIVATVLEMVEMDLEGAEDLGAYLQNMVGGIFTNETVTKLVSMLAPLGATLDDVMEDIIANQIGIDIDSWFTAFGYLMSEETWEDVADELDFAIIQPTDKAYVNNFGVEGVLNEDGTISWFFNRMPLVDGDGFTFVNILTRLLGPAEMLIKFLFAGADISAFGGLLTIIGYETYESTFGMLLEALGVENIPSQEDFNNDTMSSFANMLTLLLDWFYNLTDAEDMVAQLLEIIPDIFYYIESNGLSVLLHNVLMPVIVLIDTLRPLMDINVNQLLSIILSEFINYKTLDINVILQYLIYGIYQTPSMDLDYVNYSIDIKNLRVSDLLVLVDAILGTNLAQSNLVEYGVTGLCSGVEEVTTSEGVVFYRPTVTAADAITIIFTGLLEALEQPAQDATKTNGEVLFAVLGEMTESETIADLYPTIQSLLAGIEAEYTAPNWAYMAPGGDVANFVNAKETVSYLAYTTDWTEAKAEVVYEKLDRILVSLIPEEDFDFDIATLLNSMLEDKVYSDANLKMIVETVVNLFADINATLFDVIDVVIDTDIASWFEMCEADAEGKLVCTKDWGVDTAEDKRATFIAALEEVLAPANALLAWAFFGDNFEFFTGSEKDDDGNYIYNDVISINGGDGYERAIVPLLKALTLEPTPASDYLDAQTGKYDAAAAVSGILNTVFDLIDSLTDAPSVVGAAIDLIPNLIYFLNADGVKSAVNNLLTPINGLLDMVGPLLGEEISIATLLGDLPIDITDITTASVLTLLTEQFGVQFKATDAEGNVTLDLGAILSTLYVGKLAPYTYAADLTGYTLDVSEAEGDVLTLLISFALELFTINGDLFAGMLGENGEAIVDGIIAVLDGYTVEYTDPDWAYMYEGEDALAKLAADGFPDVEFKYLAYETDWTEETAQSVYDALDEILVMVMDSVADGNTIAQLIEGVLTDNVYTDANLVAIVELIVNAIAGFDASLLELIDVVLDTDIAAWFEMCDVDAEGKYAVKENYFEVDTAADKKVAFVAGLKEVLAPANELLAWLFFGDTYTFFNGSDGDAIITLIGGEGYAQGLVPIFEALGCTMPDAETFKDGETYNVGNAVEALLDAALALVDTISANPIEEVFALIPNLLYFINADGLNSAVTNLLAPVNGVLAEISGLVGAENLQALLTDLIDFDLSNLDMDAVLALLVKETGFVMNDEMIAVIKNIYGLGNAATFTSANTETAYKVDVTGSEYDVLTVLLSFALDAFELNEELFAGLLGAETYTAVKALLAGLAYEYNNPNWAYMYADTEEATAAEQLAADGFPAFEHPYLAYTTDWTEEVAQGVYESLDDILALVLPEVLDEGETIATLVNGLLEDNVYSDEILNTIVELIVNALASLDAGIYNAVGALLAADISAWFTMCEKNADDEYECTRDWGVDEATDKKAAFVAGIKEVLAPANELLAWLFFGDTYTFFNGTTKEVLITINGGEGYAYGLVPIFEALGCTMPDAETFKVKDGDTYNVGNAVEAILNAALALVDALSANTAEEVVKLLPNLIYFINADGLVESVKNLVAPVTAILDCLAPVTGEVDLEALLADAIGFDIFGLTTDALMGILATEVGFITNVEMVAMLKNIYAVGEAKAYTSVNGETAYRINADEADVLTVILSFALDAFNLNEALFSDLLGESTYLTVKALICGAKEPFVYQDINWAYMYEGEDALAQLEANNFPAHAEGDAYSTYLKYANNWNYLTADYVNDILDTLVQSFFESDNSLGKLLDKAISKGLYTDDILEDLIVMIVELVYDYAGIIEGAGAMLGAEGLAGWWNGDNAICTVTKDANGETVVTVTKDFGIDKAATNDEKRVKFVEAFVEVLEPAYGLLAWLLFAEDFTFFNGTTNDPLITITGGEGYAQALVPLFEAVGGVMRGADEEIVLPGTADYCYANGKTGVKAAEEFYDENGNLNMAQAVRDVFTLLTDWLYVICGDLADPTEYGVIGTMLEMLPNVVYNLNAGTLDAVVYNLLLPVNNLIDQLGAFGVELDIEGMLADLGLGRDENGNALFNWYGVFNLVEELVRLYFPDYTQEFLATLYFGTAVPYTSANGEQAYYMTFVEDSEENAGKGTKADLVTILISFVVDAFQDQRNDSRLIGWLGADTYTSIMNVLNITGAKEMQEYQWLYTEYADKDMTFSPIENSEKYEIAYNKIWTEEMAQYIADNFDEFLADLLCLLGIEIGGVKVTDLETLFDALLEGTLYTQETADSLLAVLQDLLDSIYGLEPYGEYVVALLKTAFGVDLAAWETMTVEVVDGDRASFTAALEQMLSPVVPLLDVLLCGENIELFYTIEDANYGESALIIYGSEGYAYGVIPLLEALGCKPLSPAEFKELDNEAKIGSILDTVFNRVDKIANAEQPAQEILEMLPAVIYFINSNGLDTAVKNIVNSIDTVLIALEPMLGEADLMSLLGVDLKTYNFEYLMDLVVDALVESTGMQVSPLTMNFVAELLTGQVISYYSANGEKYYTMEYAGDWQKADMVTVILRLLVDFIATDKNAEAITEFIVSKTGTEDAEYSVRTFVSLIMVAMTEEPAISSALAAIYYVFYGLNQGIGEFDEAYHDINEKWKSILLYYEKYGTDEEKAGIEIVKNILDTYFDGIFDSDGLASDGFITFFEKVLALFEKIINWFKNLFN